SWWFTSCNLLPCNHPKEQSDALAAHAAQGLARVTFLFLSTWEVRSPLSLKRATQFVDLTRPCAARHLGFNGHRRAFGVDSGKLGGRRRGYCSFRIHHKCPAKVEGARLSQCVSF